MVSLALWLILGAASGVPFQRPPADSSWTEFKSGVSHFSVMYPSSWRRLSQNLKGLDIVNFPAGQGQHGVVLSPIGANIQVVGATPRVHMIEDLVRGDLQGERPIEDSEVRITDPPKGGCATFRRVVWQQDADGSGKHIFSFTCYYCSIDSRIFSVLLINWKGDPKQPELQELALKIAQSLRTW